MGSHVFNVFEITNLRQLKTSYRLVGIDGSCGDDDLADQNLNLLAKRIAFQERSPVAIVRSSGGKQLAIPADLQLSKTEYVLTPDVVTLMPTQEAHPLSMDSLTRDTEGIGLAFLSFHLRSPLRGSTKLWSTGASSFFSVTPINYRDNRRDVDVFGGFGFRLLRMDGRLFLSLWLTNKYVDNRWLLDRYNEDEIRELKMRHLLYHYGNNRFPVQLLGVTGKSIDDQWFVPENGTKTNVYDYTMAAVGGAGAPSWITSLDPHSPGIAYQYPGNEKKRHGAAALCKLLLSTEDPSVSRLHRMSIKPPDVRFRCTSELVGRYFQGVESQGTPVRISTDPLKDRPRVFRVPALEFGQKQILRVGNREDGETVALRDLGKARMGRLLDPNCGFAVTGTLDAQWILIPETLDRRIATSFQERLEKSVRQFLHTGYRMERIVYQNKGARTLKQQVDAIFEAVDSSRASGGHGVLILPQGAKPDLHNYIKRRLHDAVQFQCVNAQRLEEFYELHPKNGRAEYTVRHDQDRKYISYLRNTAMGLLLVNRQVPWVLSDGTRYDAYIGVDVLRNTAAFTFFYEGGRRCFVRRETSKQKEKLLRNQISSVLHCHLREDLRGVAQKPRSVVLRRDGRTYESEWLGFRDAIRRLVREGTLPKDVRFGIVEVHKQFALGLRIASEANDGRLRNPRIGSWRPIGDGEGLVCNTGYPFRFDGTVKPLLVRIARGDLDLQYVLQDTFAMSLLSWPVPDRCVRLPIDLKLCDDLLRATAAEADDDEAMYGEEAYETNDVAEPERLTTYH